MYRLWYMLKYVKCVEIQCICVSRLVIVFLSHYLNYIKSHFYT